jgi:hypothetical protein
MRRAQALRGTGWQWRARQALGAIATYDMPIEGRDAWLAAVKRLA